MNTEIIETKVIIKCAGGTLVKDGGAHLTVEITPEKAAAFTLHRHHLIERAPVEEAVEVIEDMLGLNAQGALNYQISLWNRVADLDRGFIPRALYEDRSLVRSWFMRDTVHIVPSALFSTLRVALRSGLMEEWNRWTVRTGAKEAPESWEPLYQQVLDILAGGPLTRNEVLERTGRSGTDAKRDLHRLIREMSLRGLLCNAESSGPWYHNTQHRFARVDRWLPDVEYGSVTEDEAKAALARRYLRSYGPASVSDFAYWAGMKVRETNPIFEGISNSLAEVTVSGQRRKLLILEEDTQSLLDADRGPNVARLLPKFDALIMGHRDKTRFIDPSTRSSIFLPTAEVAATMLLNGMIEGVWGMKKDRKVWSLELSTFRELTKEEKDLVEKEIEGLRGFTGFEIEETWTRASA